MVGDELAARLALQAWIDDPFLGPVAAATFQADSPVSPRNARWARVELQREIRAENNRQRSVWELEYQPTDASQAPLPVAVVWDETSQPSRARVYCNKALLGNDQVRETNHSAGPGFAAASNHAAVLAGFAHWRPPGLARGAGPGTCASVDRQAGYRKPTCAPRSPHAWPAAAVCPSCT